MDRRVWIGRLIICVSCLCLLGSVTAGLGAAVEQRSASGVGSNKSVVGTATGEDVGELLAAPAEMDIGGPLAEAGLDQTVLNGTTVYLDAGGSVAPEGMIVGYEWTITRPDGTTMKPACPGCVQTTFVPEQPGRYAVTVTITDSEGGIDSDTLYVTVEKRVPPSVTVDGPNSVDLNKSATYMLDPEKGTAPLSSYLWRMNGMRIDRGFFAGGTVKTNITFTQKGVVPVNATVADVAGVSGHAQQFVTVRSQRPYVDVAIRNVTTPVEAGTEMTVETRVHNTGSNGTTQDIRLTRDDYTTIEVIEDVELGPNESRGLTLSWETDRADIGTHELTVRSRNDTASAEVKVKEDPDAEPAPFFDVEILSTPTFLDSECDVTCEDWLRVGLLVRNIGEEADTQQIRLDGSVVDGVDGVVNTTTVSLEPGNSTRLFLRWENLPVDRGTSNEIMAHSANDTDREWFEVASGPLWEGLPETLVGKVFLHLAVPEISGEGTYPVSGSLFNSNSGLTASVNTSEHSLVAYGGGGAVTAYDGQLHVDPGFSGNVTVCLSLNEREDNRDLAENDVDTPSGYREKLGCTETYIDSGDDDESDK